jgi:hypothetical protein
MGGLRALHNEDKSAGWGGQNDLRESARNFDVARGRLPRIRPNGYNPHIRLQK